MVERAFIVGVQRCGTTFVYHLLDEHPDIVMAKPVRPEPKVFLGDTVTGKPGAYDALVFPTDPSEMVRGEKSTSYLEHDAALGRIVDTFPEARFVVVLRDPVERALSHYRFSVDNGIEHRPLEEAVIQDLEGHDTAYDRSLSVSPFAYVRRGRYLEQLQRLERRVANADLHILILEDILENPTAVPGLYRFLGVNSAFQPMVGGAPTNASRSKPPVSRPVLHLLESYFAPLNRALEHYLGRELMSWH